MIQLPSGLNKIEENDNANADFWNENYDVLDYLLRRYSKEVDTTTKDATLGIYKVVNYKRPDTDSLYLKCTLSNPDANGYYQTDTWQFYDEAGTTVVKTVTWTLTYDADGIVTNAVPSS